MFTKPEIVNPKNMQNRGYIVFYFNKERKRFYDGLQVGLACSPSKCSSHRQRQEQLERLQYHIHKLLLAGWNPNVIKDHTRSYLITDIQESRIKTLFPNTVSERYKKDILNTVKKLRVYIAENDLAMIRTSAVTQEFIQGFLNTITSSGGYYMIVRNRISGLFSLFVKHKMIEINPVHKTETRKKSSKRNRAFTEKQFREVLEVIKESNSNLYLCALLMYGSFLRPHEEIRRLSRDNFNEDLTMISIDGEYVKNRKLRVTPVPSYVRKELIERGIDKLQPDINIFSRKNKPFKSDEYFSNIWKKVKRKLKIKKLATADHTLYSIRHTAAVSLFRRTQDLPKLSQLMGHSNVNITIVYLKSLGVLLNITEDDLPQI